MDLDRSRSTPYRGATSTLSRALSSLRICLIIDSHDLSNSTNRSGERSALRLRLLAASLGLETGVVQAPAGSASVESPAETTKGVEGRRGVQQGE